MTSGQKHLTACAFGILLSLFTSYLGFETAAFVVLFWAGAFGGIGIVLEHQRLEGEW